MPAAEQPLPRLRRVEPPQRPAGGRAGRLVQPAVAVEREGQVGAVGRVFGLVGSEFGLRGERQAGEVVVGAGGRSPRVRRACGVEPVPRQTAASNAARGRVARRRVRRWEVGGHLETGSQRSVVRGQWSEQKPGLFGPRVTLLMNADWPVILPRRSRTAVRGRAGRACRWRPPGCVQISPLRPRRVSSRGGRIAPSPSTAGVASISTTVPSRSP